MNEEPVETPVPDMVPDREPVKTDVGQTTEGQTTEKNSSEPEKTSEAPPAPAPAQEPLARVAPAQKPLVLVAPAKEPLALLAPAKEPLALLAPAKEPLALVAPAQKPLALLAPAKEPLALVAPAQKPLALVAPAKGPLALVAPVATKETPSSDPVKEPPGEVKDDAKAPGGEPPVDWFEPLEDDDYDDDESLAGESERSESVAGSERMLKKIYQFQLPRRKRSHPDEGWEDWPILGEGWKRKEVVRRSGSSIGQKDVYYMSPRGDRVRSRVELTSVLEGHLDLSTFEYKSGKFLEGDVPHIRVRNRAKRKVRERSSSESSFMERGEGADTPDSHHVLPPVSLAPKSFHSNQTSFSLHSTVGTPTQGYRNEDPVEDKIKLPLPSSSSKALLLPSINGDVGSEDNTLVCSRCGISFTGTWYDKQRKRPCCPNCWAASKTKEHPMVRFRKKETFTSTYGAGPLHGTGHHVSTVAQNGQTTVLTFPAWVGVDNVTRSGVIPHLSTEPLWIPCGQCVGCHNTLNCGQCANCKHGLQSPETRKRLCRKRKCICPIRKGPGGGGFLPPQMPYIDVPEPFDDSMSFQSEVAESQLPSLKSSDTENFSVNVDLDDDDDMSTDDDDDWHKKRKRRSCGDCKACLCRKDCGTCDFCVDKPKFGGSNKKRQKCRLRQCQRQAMRHLLPYQMGQSDHGPDGQLLPGRPRPHYTYSRKSGLKKNKGPQSSFDFDDNDDDDSNLQALNPLDFGLQNGLPDRVPTQINNHNNSQLEQLSRWEAEKSHATREIQKLVEDVEEDDDDDEEDEEEEEELPMITQIFSLADNASGSGADIENQLLKLLHSLRSHVMPILWYAIMVEGPQLQLIQCSKQSNLTDTMVLIDPGFCYQVTVQKQPLLPTHPLYDRYPARLSSVSEVVALLLGLEEYVVCQGLPPKEPLSNTEPIILERASTCDFLVKRKVSTCSDCRALQGL
ncbi:methyl-CpG-binding domain protein 1b isoform X3 [Sebastes fasciatus]|uniref:methyl-CpG-binding domain protein 1b isoform X3 n=1 Tax=Sebastes fasciatus TaxID=394691 RepID=UPI003D9EC0AF